MKTPEAKKTKNKKRKTNDKKQRSVNRGSTIVHGILNTIDSVVNPDPLRSELFPRSGIICCSDKNKEREKQIIHFFLFCFNCKKFRWIVPLKCYKQVHSSFLSAIIRCRYLKKNLNMFNICNWGRIRNSQKSQPDPE